MATHETTVEALLQSDPLISPNPNDPNDARLLLSAARHVETMEEPVLIPKKFMSSTWHLNTSMHKILFEEKDVLKALLYDLMYKGPLPKAEGKLPVISVWDQHKWVFPRTLPPLLLQFISMKLFNYTWSLPLAFGIYALWWGVFAKMLAGRLGSLVAKHGYLDQSVSRDHIPDIKTTWTGIVIIGTVVIRPLFGTFIAYDRTELPHLSLWLPINAFIHVAILDFYYYWYHRVMHESDLLWRFHKVHHMTKHPTYVLSGFADVEQDMFDVVIIPILAVLTYKIDFFTWWIASLYIFHTEAMGHSGLRAYVPTTLASTFLQPFGLELEIEDHDLHHRNGWRKSFNYGKQTKIWDTLFGTTRPRIECVPDNIAW